MVFFRKKKNREEDIKEIKNVVEGKKIAEKIKEQVEEKFPEKREEKPPIKEEELEKIPEVTEKPKKPTFAPLFVKIDRYKVVLDLINSLKNTIMTLKNALEMERHVEELSEKNRNVLESCINKINEQILSLDSEFLRPKGYEKEIPTPIYETDELEGTVSDLKKQIEDLKSEIKTIS